jgi:hypothetical protein
MGLLLVMVFSWWFPLSVLITLNFFKIFLHFGTFRYVMRKKALIFYSFIGTCYQNFEQKKLLLLFHDFFAFKRKATLMDFVDDNVFSS